MQGAAALALAKIVRITASEPPNHWSRILRVVASDISSSGIIARKQPENQQAEEIGSELYAEILPLTLKNNLSLGRPTLELNLSITKWHCMGQQ